MTRDAGDISLEGARSLSRTRDGAAPSPYRVSFTDPDGFLDEVRLDAQDGAVEAGIVRIAIINAPATLEQVEGRWVPGPDRVDARMRAKYVQASYHARRQLVALSAYCGVAWISPAPPPERLDHLTRLCALALQETTNHLVGAIDRLEGIQRRGGGVYIGEGETWVAHYLSPIEALEAVVCATCGVDIYYANGAWRHKATKRAEVLKADGRHLDHLADPIEKGRTV